MSALVCEVTDQSEGIRSQRVGQAYGFPNEANADVGPMMEVGQDSNGLANESRWEVGNRDGGAADLNTGSFPQAVSGRQPGRRRAACCELESPA